MQNIVYYPNLALQPFIDHYRIWKYQIGTMDESLFKDYPRTAMDMVFCLEGQLQLTVLHQSSITLAPFSFVGHFDKAYLIQPKADITLVSIRFKSNGIYPLTKMPLQRFLNHHIELADLLGNSTLQLAEQLKNTISNHQKIQLLENYFSPIFLNSDLHYRLDGGVQMIQQCKGQITVKELSHQLNTNYKSLDRWFNKKIGLSPKRFIQLTRFKHILENIESTNQPNWMNLVVQHGFYDQAHFIKEFKQFAGICPSEYVQEHIAFSRHFER